MQRTRYPGAAGFQPPAPVVALAVVAATLASATAPVFPLDDAYITLHNARALLAGGADASYGGSALSGATSAVHLVLVALAGWLMPLETALHLVTIFAVALYAMGLDRLAVVTGCNRSVLVVAGLLTGFMPFQLLNGLETGLALAAVTWTIVLVDHRRLPWLLGLLLFVRPELALLAAPLMVRCCWRDRRSPRLVAANLAMAAGSAVPWLLLYWVATGVPFPTTGGVKIVYFAELHRSLPEKLRIFRSVVVGSAIGPLLAGVFGLLRQRGGGGLLVFLLLWLGISVESFAGGLGHNFYRYLALAVPVLLYGATPLLAMPRRGRIAGAVLVLWAALSGWLGVAIFRQEVTSQALPTLAADARRTLPAGARVLVHDAGYLAWRRPDLHITEVVGLKSAASARIHAETTAFTNDRGEALERIARSSRAQYLVVLAGNPFWSETARVLRARHWTLQPLATPAGGYAIFRLLPPVAAAG